MIRGELPIESEDPVIAKQSAEGFALAYYSFYSETLSDVEITDYLLRTVKPALSTVRGLRKPKFWWQNLLDASLDDPFAWLH